MTYVIVVVIQLLELLIFIKGTLIKLLNDRDWFGILKYYSYYLEQFIRTRLEKDIKREQKFGLHSI